jgi:hypothetical protein
MGSSSTNTVGETGSSGFNLVVKDKLPENKSLLNYFFWL